VTETFHNTQSTSVQNTIDVKTLSSFIHVSSPTEIQLKVGSSTITVTPDTITLHSANIVFEGTTKIQGSAPKIAFAADSEAQVSAPKTTISGDNEASLGVGSQTVKCNTSQVGISGAAIASSATGKHDISGAVVKIN
jgi:type VI secretion system secreted protein VgrG